MPAGPRRSSLPLHQGGPLPEGQGPHLPWAGLPSGGAPILNAGQEPATRGDALATAPKQERPGGGRCAHTQHTCAQTHAHTPTRQVAPLRLGSRMCPDLRQ